MPLRVYDLGSENQYLLELLLTTAIGDERTVPIILPEDCNSELQYPQEWTGTKHFSKVPIGSPSFNLRGFASTSQAVFLIFSKTLATAVDTEKLESRSMMPGQWEFLLRPKVLY
ncbi:hypothetical protein CVT26_013531 [Gymnopilus dilepis]|uniref:Uncharacterized protein n=1 Tax=Gymnopilus dilepis TaxID=231916 RepID=A0A409Y5F8_9AGAR|nr:hypothetical protein CVT26_013531 [Gymnopilus dilepis]